MTEQSSDGRRAETIETQAPSPEKAVLARIVLPDEPDEEVEESLAEMNRLAWTAGAQVVCTIVQSRSKPSPATLLGKGKVEEIRAACEELGAEMVIVDSDLSPAQGANIEDALGGLKVVDRTQLILDIFAQRARTNEGKNQVELAQLQYILPRLAGRGSIMRQQGGIGVRGPGEQKLEVDRRVIRDRIHRLQKELETVRQRRRIQRKRRGETGQGSVALVGYTNAGKSSLLNALVQAEVFVEDKLFATLDPTTRRYELPSGREVVFTDTVGFVRRLPHGLVAAFRATLEEVNESDLLLLVADASYGRVDDHIRTVHGVLDEIEVHSKPMLLVFNKLDAIDPPRRQELQREHPDALFISARTGEGLDGLLRKVDAFFGSAWLHVRLRIPQREAAVVAKVHDAGRVLDQRYEGNDVLLDAEVHPALGAQLDSYRDDGRSDGD